MVHSALQTAIGIAHHGDLTDDTVSQAGPWRGAAAESGAAGGGSARAVGDLEVGLRGLRGTVPVNRDIAVMLNVQPAPGLMLSVRVVASRHPDT